MKIDHIAVWTAELEAMKDFYERYFGATSGSKYVNEAKGFESYFLVFSSGSVRLELMRIADLGEISGNGKLPYAGYAHLAMSVGSKDAVDALTNRLRKDGFTVVGEPRVTGDGYYESVVLDPDGNLVEITV